MNQNPMQMIANLQQSIMNLQMSVNWFVEAFLDVLQESDPEIREKFAKRHFYQRCKSFMLGTEQARNAGNLDAVMGNSSVIEGLKKEAKAKDWLSLFHKAQREAEHYGREMVEGKGGHIEKP